MLNLMDRSAVVECCASSCRSCWSFGLQTVNLVTLVGNREVTVSPLSTWSSLTVTLTLNLRLFISSPRAFIFASVCVLFSLSRQRKTVSAPTPASLTASTDRPLEAGPRSWTSTDTPFMCPTTHRRRCSSLTLIITDSSMVPMLMRENLSGYHGFCAGPGDQLA